LFTSVTTPVAIVAPAFRSITLPKSLEFLYASKQIALSRVISTVAVLPLIKALKIVFLLAF
jgi:hypothetical protein